MIPVSARLLELALRGFEVLSHPIHRGGQLGDFILSRHSGPRGQIVSLDRSRRHGQRAEAATQRTGQVQPEHQARRRRSAESTPPLAASPGPGVARGCDVRQRGRLVPLAIVTDRSSSKRLVSWPSVRQRKIAERCQLWR